jgi:RNA polymerase sigma-70 factor (ECF subfamily)
MSLFGDRRLAKRILSGDKRAGERLVTEAYPRVYRMLRSLVGNQDTAQDLTQQTFIKAWQAIENYRGEASLSTWLHRIAYHEYTHWLRDRRETASIDEQPEIVAPDCLKSLHSMMLERAMAQLSEDHQGAFVLCHVWQYSTNEAGAIVGVPAGTIKSRLFEARRRLRELLAEPNLPSATERFEAEQEFEEKSYHAPLEAITHEIQAGY